MHKIEISPAVMDRVKALRGRIHMFDRLDPARTAHIIVDLQNGFMEPGAAVEIPQAREIVPNVNRISAAVRAAGGLNAFIRYLIDHTAITQWSTWFSYFATPERRKVINETFCCGCHGFELWSELEVQVHDLIVDKTRFGAFVPGASDLHNILQARGIDTWRCAAPHATLRRSPASRRLGVSSIEA
jgi:ureidoacrylate peracid hydrolase